MRPFLLCFLLSFALPLRAQEPRFSDLRRSMPAERGETSHVALGDVDGDGDPDLVAADQEDGARFARNEGRRFAPWVTLDAGPADAEVGCVALLDADMNGTLDVALGRHAFDDRAQPVGATNLVYLNDGSGNFAPAAAPLSDVDDQTSDVGTADLDGNGSPDLFFAGESRFVFPPFSFIPGEAVHLNDGAGGFTLGGYDGLGTSRSIALGDIDGDGDVDAFLTRSGTVSGSWVQLNDGAGTFSPTTGSLPALTTFGARFFLADVNEDGWADAFDGENLWTADGLGGFVDASAGLPPGAEPALTLAFGDVDGDLHVDALIAGFSDSGTADMCLYLGDGAGGFADWSADLPEAGIVSIFSRVTAVVLDDLDGDGDLDAAIGANRQPNLLWLGDGSGGFLDAQAFAGDTLRRGGTLHFGDFDGNGTLDAFGTNSLDDLLALGDGLGNFVDASANLPAVALGSSESAGLIDADGDGDQDVLIGRTVEDRLLLNDGCAVFTELPGALPVPAFQNVTKAIAAFDLDGDGDQDAMLASSQMEWVYTNDGTGIFSDESDRLPEDENDRSQAIGVADLDGDGDLDAVFGGDEAERLYLNDGTGHFLEGTLPTNLGVVSAFAIADAELDGDQDVLVGVEGSARSKLLLNDGSAGFVSAGVARFPGGSRSVRSVAFADVDSDGDPDIVLGNANFGTILPSTPPDEDQLYRNDGTGHFALVADAFPFDPGGLTWSLSVLDLDGDGDQDIVKGGGSGPLANLARQVSWRSVPGVGKDLELELHGPAGTPWWLLAAPLAAEVPVPPLGILRLDPTTLALLEAGGLDANGDGATAIPVPNLPSLVDRTLHLQAAVGLPPLLTNLESAVLTGF